MNTDRAAVVEGDPSTVGEAVPGEATGGGQLPTVPCSVVWSGGHAYVREGGPGRAHWVGLDGRGRPLVLTDADLLRRGWTRTRRG
ncbi:MAG TPA: hypothetical protein VIL00_03030 [Pseudonocardiaceae bacterium]